MFPNATRVLPTSRVFRWGYITRKHVIYYLIVICLSAVLNVHVCSNVAGIMQLLFGIHCFLPRQVLRGEYLPPTVSKCAKVVSLSARFRNFVPHKRKPTVLDPNTLRHAHPLTCNYFNPFIPKSDQLQFSPEPHQEYNIRPYEELDFS